MKRNTLSATAASAIIRLTKRLAGMYKSQEEIDARVEREIDFVRGEILMATPDTLTDVTGLLVTLHHRAWTNETEDDEEDPTRTSLVIARVLKIVAEHAGVDLRAIGGDTLIDYDCDVFPEFAA